MEIDIKISCDYKEMCFKIEDGAPIAPLLKKHSLLDFPCGIGNCGKCLIYANSVPTPEEIEKLGQDAINTGLRLACYTIARENLEITVPPKKALCVLSSFTTQLYDFSPAISKLPVTVSAPSVEAPETDVNRLLAASGAKDYSLTLLQQAMLPNFLQDIRKNDGQVYALLEGETLVGFSGEEESHGLIVDIGTTTVAATLVRLDSQRIVSTKGEHNAQYPYGADVISRIRSSCEKGVAPLRDAIVRQINSILDTLLDECGLVDVSLISLSGNTTMMHLLCGLSPEFLGKAPFTPVTTQAMEMNARQLGIESDSRAFLLPSISSYIGADIVASLLAVSAQRADRPFLLIDFGTNAETVLFANGKFYCCSAAAGPCFEGANLSCGMAGQAGAIDTVDATETGFSYTVVENEEARGICGSGVLDAVAMLLDVGVVDETGRMETNFVGPIGSNLDSERGLVFTDKISMTQGDVREIQLAKAAVRAGIDVLCHEAGIKYDDIETLYLAGGFGSALRARSAARIGLIPEELLDKVAVLGNATSFGTLRYATERNAQKYVQSIIDRAEYVELSACKSFSDCYINQMLFPEGLECEKHEVHEAVAAV